MTLGGHGSWGQQRLPGEGGPPVGVSSLRTARDGETHAHWRELCPLKLTSTWTLRAGPYLGTWLLQV